MKTEDELLDPALADDVERAAGHQLLGRLEDQPDPARQRVGVGGEGQPGAQHHRGVHVVAAGVADAVVARAVGHVLLVLQRQRVDVRAQADDDVALAELADQAGPALQHLGRQPRVHEPVDQQPGRPPLLTAQLGVGVHVAAEGDQVLAVRREPAVGGRRAVDGHQTAPGAAGCPSAEEGSSTGSAVGRSSANSVSRLSTTAVRSPPLAAATARWRW